MHSLSDHAQPLLNGLFKVTSNSHYLAHRLHGRAEFLIHTMELGQIPTRYLADHIVKGRFKECRSGLCYRVFQFEEAVAHTQLGSHESQRITRCLTGKCGRTTQTGVHLNYPIIFRLRIKGVLHITLAHNADMAYNLDSQRTQLMILRICQRLRRSNHDTLTRMNA